MAIDEEFIRWLRKQTPNKDLPWGAQVLYVRDWKAATLGRIINARADSQLRDLITTVVDKVITNQAITTVLFSRDVQIDGMLQKVTTEPYGDLTLLRLLRSLKATPSQAAMAAKAAGEVDEEGYERVRRQSRPGELPLTAPALDGPLGQVSTITPSTRKSDREVEKHRQMELANHI